MTANDLVSKKCIPCEGTERPLTSEEYAIHLSGIPGWTVIEEKKITKKYTFKNFVEALAFVDSIGVLAEKEGHHPDILLHNWKCVTVTLSTHAIHGLSLNDFILAAKIDVIPQA